MHRSHDRRLAALERRARQLAPVLNLDRALAIVACAALDPAPHAWRYPEGWGAAVEPFRRTLSYREQVEHELAGRLGEPVTYDELESACALLNAEGVGDRGHLASLVWPAPTAAWYAAHGWLPSSFCYCMVVAELAGGDAAPCGGCPRASAPASSPATRALPLRVEVMENPDALS